MLIVRCGLGKPCLVIVSVKMAHLHYTAINGEPVGMDIKQRHEDAHHDTAVMKILILVNFLDDNNLAVGRGYDNPLCVLHSKLADGAAEEIQDNKPYNAKHHGKRPEWYLGVECLPQHYANGYDEECTVYKGVCAFTVYAYFLYTFKILYSLSHYGFFAI